MTTASFASINAEIEERICRGIIANVCKVPMTLQRLSDHLCQSGLPVDGVVGRRAFSSALITLVSENVIDLSELSNKGLVWLK